MIDKLTKEQKRKIPKYIKKWTEIGLEYKDVEINKAKKILQDYLSIINIKPKNYFIFDSPMACNLVINLFKNLDSQLSSQLSSQKLEYYSIWNFYQCGNINAGYCCFYDFLISEVKDVDEKTMNLWNKFKNVSEYLHFFFVFEDFVFLSRKPKLSFNNENQLHADMGPAVKYNDGYSMFNLGGVNCPEWLVMTEEKKIDCKKIYEIENTEVRQQFIKKVGLERLFKELDVEIIEDISADDLYRQFPITNWIDQGDVLMIPEFEKKVKYKNLTNSMKRKLKNINYKLINMNLGEENYRPYLYMTNASMFDDCHIEGVEKANNVFEALCWANQKETLPYLLS